MCVCFFFFHPARLYSHCQRHLEVICFPFSCLPFFFFFLLSTSHVRGLKFKHREKNKNKKKTGLMLLWTPQAKHPDSKKRRFRCDSFPTPLCSAHRHRRRPLGGRAPSPPTERTTWPRPAPALPEELRPKPLRGRGGARPAESWTNERSAHPPLQGWLITSAQSSPFKE